MKNRVTAGLLLPLATTHTPLPLHIVIVEKKKKKKKIISQFPVTARVAVTLQHYHSAIRTTTWVGGGRFRHASPFRAPHAHCPAWIARLILPILRLPYSLVTPYLYQPVDVPTTDAGEPLRNLQFHRYRATPTPAPDACPPFAFDWARLIGGCATYAHTHTHAHTTRTRAGPALFTQFSDLPYMELYSATHTYTHTLTHTLAHTCNKTWLRFLHTMLRHFPHTLPHTHTSLLISLPVIICCRLSFSSLIISTHYHTTPLYGWQRNIVVPHCSSCLWFHMGRTASGNYRASTARAGAHLDQCHLPAAPACSMTPLFWAATGCHLGAVRLHFTFTCLALPLPAAPMPPQPPHHPYPSLTPVPSLPTYTPHHTLYTSHYLLVPSVGMDFLVAYTHTIPGFLAGMPHPCLQLMAPHHPTPT